VADNWQAFASAANYAFNDAHAVMAFVGAGRLEQIAQVMEAQDRAMAAAGDNARFTREVGRPVVLGLKAFGEGDYAGCIAAIQPVIPIANRFGGSHAQRDVLDLTVMEAAFRLPDPALARALSMERRSMKPDSLHARTMSDRARVLPTAL
jgi:hypothetical protein